MSRKKKKKPKKTRTRAYKAPWPIVRRKPRRPGDPPDHDRSATWTTRAQHDSRDIYARSVRDKHGVKRQSSPNRPFDRVLAHGNQAYQKGDWEQAIKDFSDAIRLIPRDSTAYKSRGDAHARLGSRDKAVCDYNSAIRANPNYADAHFAKGVILSEQGVKSWLAASYAFAQATRLDPRLENNYRQLRVKPSIENDAAPRVDLNLVRKLRLQGKRWSEIVDAHPAIRTSAGEYVKPPQASIIRAERKKYQQR